MPEPELSLRSELIDLTGMSLTALRACTDPALSRSVANLLSEADDPWIAALRLQSASGGNGC
ncbi:hypothetical protein [Kutzneria sp. CA-103260]|uniref:hypothetical protein n=1 Tax=Kutzneria sp. CA-103260 TaxID=2802641 RepID=UPI001BA9FA4C|nr:hypothetical protein [Kutzneria sp. CA-103260]QUQ62444.1 hypothetical protein JJ691_01560 [Kutzneria sp. CA-103260]